MMKGAGKMISSWSYHGKTGPTCWADLGYPDCAASAQSPIKISLDGVKKNDQLGFITYSGYDSPPSSMKLSNDGHTLELSIGDTATISGGGLPGTYKALHVHFHWGSNDSKGSEHIINCKKYPAEMHIVHYNTKYTPDVAVSKSDGLAVLGFLIQIGDFNPGLDKVLDLDLITSVKYKGQEVSLTPFSLNKLLPCSQCNFFRYQGSLTTPPCSESVTWTIFQTPICISQGQLLSLRGLMKTEAGEQPPQPLVDNFRPVQDLNGRQVESNEEITGKPECQDDRGSCESCDCD